MSTSDVVQGDVEWLVEELQSHPVTSNEFFRTFQAKWLTPRQLRVFVRQYHYFCYQFVKVLEGLLYHTPIEQLNMRIVLAKTLYSELGNGSPDHVHIRRLERFAHSIGLQPHDLDETEPIPEVQTYLEVLHRKFLKSNYLTALGAELAVEATASSEFEYFFTGLQKYQQFNRRDLEFFESHLAEEAEHKDWLLEAVRKTAQSPEDLEQVFSGAYETADAWLKFWEGMYRAVFDANPPDSIY